MIEAVLFDLDDTLHDDTLTYRRAAQAVARDVAPKCGIDADVLLAAYVAQAESFWSNLSTETFGTPLVGLRARMWAAALADAGVRDDALAQRCAVAYNEHRREFLELWPGALDLLVRLRASGYKLAMITNGFAETHREKIAILQLETAFDEVFIADEVGMIKPDPRLFRLAAERLGVAPQACAMVGDRFERDVRGAQAAGMFTIWMNVRGEEVPADAAAPDAIVAQIGEVEAALAATVARGPRSCDGGVSELR